MLCKAYVQDGRFTGVHDAFVPGICCKSFHASHRVSADIPSVWQRMKVSTWYVSHFTRGLTND